MKIVVGSDHAGFPMKAELLAFLKEHGHEVLDVGSFDPAPVDFPDIARKVAAAIVSGQVERGLMVCGTGVGASIGANATTTVKRTDFNAGKYAPYVGDDVTITIAIEAIKE